MTKVFKDLEKETARTTSKPTVWRGFKKAVLWSIVPITWVWTNLRLIGMEFDANTSAPQKIKERTADIIEDSYLNDSQLAISNYHKQLIKIENKLAKANSKISDSSSKKRKKLQSKILNLSDLRQELLTKIRQNQQLQVQLRKELMKVGR